MKKLFLASIFILSFSFLAFAQERNSPCPELSVKVSNHVVQVGDLASFTAISGTEPQNHKYEYEWTVEPKLVFSGQGTSIINIFTNEELARSNIIATIKIKGLPESCKNTASNVIIVSNLVSDCGLGDSYGKVKIEEEYSRFDNLFVALQNNPDAKAFVLFEIKKDENPGFVRNRFIQISKHFKRREFDRDRIIFKACQSETHLTSIWLLNKDDEIPKREKCEEINIDLK